MAKQPDIKTIVDVWEDRDKINYNFEQIQLAFDNALFRDGSLVDDISNAMNADLDIGDADVLNVNVFKGENALINGVNLLSYEEYLMYRINQLPYTTGSLIYAPEDNEVGVLEIGADGYQLCASGTTPDWCPETDTDTIGVTVQEDGVTIAENVTTINFIYPGGTAVTTPASNQADVDLDTVQGVLWEDTAQANTNIQINFTDTTPLGNAGALTRLDLINDVGLSAVPTSDGDYYVIAEASSWIDSAGSNPISGNYGFDIGFYLPDGTSSPATGTLMSVSGDVALYDSVGSAAFHRHDVIFCPIPAGCRYIDFGWFTVPTVPLGVVDAAWSDRYRAVIRSSQRDSFTTPLGKGYPSAQYTTATPDPNP